MDDVRERYDKLLHLADEVKMPREELIREAKKLFPDFTGIDVYDEVFSNYDIEVYMNSRALGLSPEDAAHSAEISNTVIVNALEGVGLTIERFLRLAKAELFAGAQLVTRLLSTIERAESAIQVNAAISLLEKIRPQEYGKAAGLVTEDTDGKPVQISFTVREDD